MAKVHLQANSGENREPMAYCSARWVLNAQGQVRVRDNGRRSYVGMGSPIVNLEGFKATPATDRCAHCCDKLLERRNIKRKAEGKDPVAAYNHGWENG